MIIKLKHELNKDESILRVKNIIRDLKMQYSGVIKDSWENWNHDTVELGFNIQQMRVRGIMKFEEKTIKLELRIPFLATMFKSRIKSEIENYADLYLK